MTMATSKNTRYVRGLFSLFFLLVPTRRVKAQTSGMRHEQSLTARNESIMMEHHLDAHLVPRNLQEDPTEESDFVPLSCNNNMAPCQLWSTVVGPNSTVEDIVIVDCGTCLLLDHAGPVLTLERGIDIRGKLVISDEVNNNEGSPQQWRLQTPLLVVQGVLEVTSTKDAVDGTPFLVIEMLEPPPSSTGSMFGGLQRFTPVGENADACAGHDCFVGDKAMVVAGGTIQVNAISSDTPTWVRLHDVPDPSVILVTDAVHTRWLPGAEILITSHTRVWNDHQVRTVTQVVVDTDGYVQLHLEAPIVQPTTELESADFAVEVALLSRNVVWDGFGGHFTALRTPDVVQTIQGVDIRNFGQQGMLGRYPIHFHFCGDLDGTVVAKNTIRQSNQRCIVLHGTNNAMVMQNVAYDTAGHCYVTEDGIETGNQFIGNIGAQTRRVNVLIPDDGTNGDESDDEPATFWMTNPTNSYAGNVAAGSEDSGFWFAYEMRGTRAHLYPNYDPMREALTLFDNNIAHSNAGNSAFRSYQPGYLPDAINTLSRVKAYRNRGSGINLHKVHNVVLENSLFADNSVGVDLDRMDGIEIHATNIIGESDSYRQLQLRQNVEAICKSRRIVGLELHTWKLHKELPHIRIKDVSFSGFGDECRCLNRMSLRMDPRNLKQGQFEVFTAFEAISVEDDMASFNFCYAENAGIDQIYLIDLDGSLNPSGSNSDVVAPSTLLGRSAEIERFVNATKCTLILSGCFQYCEDTCFRSIRYEMDPSENESVTLKVCQAGTDSNCSIFGSSKRGTRDSRTIIAHLPAGSTYTAAFQIDGADATLNAYEEILEENLCDDQTLSIEIVPAITMAPSTAPSQAPSAVPTDTPSMNPTSSPSSRPTASSIPSTAPSLDPTISTIPSTAPFDTTETPTLVPVQSTSLCGLADFQGECTTTRQCQNIYLAADDCWRGGGGVCLCATEVCGCESSPTAQPTPLPLSEPIARLVLVNATDRREITLLYGEDVIELNSVGSALSILVETAASFDVNRVRFRYNGIRHVEGRQPFVMGGKAGSTAFGTVSYLSSIGEKMVVVDAFGDSGIVQSKVLKFTVVKTTVE